MSYITYLAHKIMNLTLKIFNSIFPKVCKNCLGTFVHRTLDILFTFGRCLDDAAAGSWRQPLNAGIVPQQQLRVIGGKDARAHSWPWHIALYQDEHPKCGGSIYNHYWIITAAHCVYVCPSVCLCMLLCPRLRYGCGMLTTG